MARTGSPAGSGPEVLRFTDAGLGNDSYLLVADGTAAAVDPIRDVRPYLSEAERRGLEIRVAAETHLHADFVSGAVELAARGAEVLASAGGALSFPHRPVGDGDRLDLEGVGLVALATPGHTPEHVAYLVEADPPVLFSGGALLPGWAARTDLLGPDLTEELARSLYRTLHERLDEMPDETVVHPTHGAGSFCTAPTAGGSRSTTLGAERASNPLLAPQSEDAFVKLLLSGFGDYPPYFLRLREVNRRGPRPLAARPAPRQLSPDEVEAEVKAATVVVDVRPVEAYAAGHLRGSLSIPLEDSFALWLGWVVPWGARILLVAGAEDEAEEAATRAAGIGFEDVAGWADLEALVEAGLEAAAVEVLGPDELARRLATPGPPTVVDVRRPEEVATGRIPGALHVEAWRLAAGVPAPLARGPVVTYCGSGARAATAASLLERAGAGPLAILPGGPPRWRESGRALETG